MNESGAIVSWLQAAVSHVVFPCRKPHGQEASMSDVAAGLELN